MGKPAPAVLDLPPKTSVTAMMEAAHALEWRDPPALLRDIRTLTEGRGCEIVIEAVGAQGPLDLAADLTAVRGRLVIAGCHQDGPRQINVQSWNWKGLDVVNAHERDPRVYVAGREAAVRAAAGGVFPLQELLTHPYSLEDLPRAMQDMEERPEGFLKGWIRYD